jgi:hypothetical protein
MATKPPGPWGGQSNPATPGDGGVAVASQPKPPAGGNGFSLFGSAEAAFSRAATSIASTADAVAATLKVQAEGLQKGIRNDLEGAYCIFVARLQAELYTPEAMLEETGCQLQAIVSGIIPGLLEMLGVVGATTILGAGIGGAIGFFAGGVGAAPGVVIGGELGFDIGMAALTWLGLGFLVAAIAEGFAELAETLRDGVLWAWQAKDLKGEAQKEQIDKAAHKMAKAAGILMRLLLQGILAYVLKKAAMGATRGALATGRSFATQGARATADASVAEVAGRLRASKFGDGFAKWIEDNWEDLKKNPKLQAKGKQGASGRPGSSEGAGAGASQEGATQKSTRADRGRSTDSETDSAEGDKKSQSTQKSATAVPPPGQIPYGSSDLSQKAITYRQAEGVTGGRNVAVFEYKASDGSLQTVAAASERGVGHAERIAADQLSDMGVQPSQVTRIYSELQPCNVPGGYCAPFIARTFPQAEVTWSFEYGATPESRAAGVAALKAAQGTGQ